MRRFIETRCQELLRFVFRSSRRNGKKLNPTSYCGTVLRNNDSSQLRVLGPSTIIVTRNASVSFMRPSGVNVRSPRESNGNHNARTGIDAVQRRAAVKTNDGTRGVYVYALNSLTLENSRRRRIARGSVLVTLLTRLCSRCNDIVRRGMHGRVDVARIVNFSLSGYNRIQTFHSIAVHSDAFGTYNIILSVYLGALNSQCSFGK